MTETSTTTQKGGKTMANKTKEFLDPEHLRHFGLKADPFFDLGDHKNIWLNSRLEKIKHLMVLTAQNQGIMVMTGDFGAGKSTMLRHVLREMMSDGITKLIMPDRLDRKELKGDQLSLAIIDQMGTPGMTVPGSTVRRDKLVKELLTKAIQRGEQPFLVIDEAHDLRPEIFISLKRLWDSGLIFRNIGILLAGAGGVDSEGCPWGLRWEIEGNPELKEFAERTRLVDMGRLTDGLTDYLSWRFTEVGTLLESVFAADAVAILAERAQTPQLLGILAIRAMREAYLDGALKVTAVHAQVA
jgi:type II secretory pathway predicted ATPase ExeA